MEHQAKYDLAILVNGRCLTLMRLPLDDYCNKTIKLLSQSGWEVKLRGVSMKIKCPPSPEPRGPGRPKIDNPKTQAERQQTYRDKQKQIKLETEMRRLKRKQRLDKSKNDG